KGVNSVNRNVTIRSDVYWKFWTLGKNSSTRETETDQAAHKAPRLDRLEVSRPSSSQAYIAPYEHPAWTSPCCMFC
ncbi:mCG1043953, partial [Mus musculus]